MEFVKKIIRPLISKKLEININENKTNLFLFDWEKLLSEHDEVIAKAKGMSEDEMYDFMSANETDVMQLAGYFMDEECEERIENNEWLPFGVLGLNHSPSSFAETSNGGMLLFDLTSEDLNNPEIILYQDLESTFVAKNFSKLAITEVEV
jgi:hypothetical protein